MNVAYNIDCMEYMRTLQENLFLQLAMLDRMDDTVEKTKYGEK